MRQFFFRLLCVSLLCCAGQVSADTLQLNCQSVFPLSLPIAGDAILSLSGDLSSVSEGQLSLKVFEPGHLVDTHEIASSVSNKTIDAAFSIAGLTLGNIPAANFFAAVPFGPEPSEFLAWLYRGNGLRLYQELYDRHGYNLVVLPMMLITAESSGWYTKPIEKLEDLQGLRLRFFGLAGQVLRKIGVSPIPLPPKEIASSLKKGAVDGAEFACPSMDRGIGLHKVVKYNYFPGWHQPATVAELLINRDVWNSLPLHQQKMITLVAKSSLLDSLAASEAFAGPISRENEVVFGVRNMTWPDDMQQAFRSSWEEVARENAAADPFFKKVMDDLALFRADYAKWRGLGYLPR